MMIMLGFCLETPILVCQVNANGRLNFAVKSLLYVVNFIVHNSSLGKYNLQEIFVL